MLTKEFTGKVLAMGEEALRLLEQFLVKGITVGELQSKLQAMDASALVNRYWDVLTRCREAAPALEILQLLVSLPENLGYQVAHYGASSLTDDRDQLSFALSRLV